MANREHVALIRRGVRAWNRWRRSNPGVRPDLSGLRIEGGADGEGVNLAGADLSRTSLRRTRMIEADLTGADLSSADLAGANLSGARLPGARLRGAKLGGAELMQADLSAANLRGLDLREVDLFRTLLRKADLRGAVIRRAREALLARARLDGADLAQAQLPDADLTDARMPLTKLRGANLTGATLVGADLREGDLREAELIGANLTDARLSRARLQDANLGGSILTKTDFTGAHLTGAYVYGTSVWDVKLRGAEQSGLSITPHLQVDNLEVAQFIYLLLNNARIKQVIETVTSKAVLILGRFTPARKAVLDLIRVRLRQRDLLPLMFDFEQPSSRSILETVSLLAHMSRFVIADLTDASFVTREVPRVLGQLRVPVQPIISKGQPEPARITRLRARHPTLLPLHRYRSPRDLLARLDELLAQAGSPAPRGR